MKIGDKIRVARQKIGISQVDLALKVGYTTSGAISRIEANQRDFPFSKLSDFAQALQVSESYLLGLDTETDLSSLKFDNAEVSSLEGTSYTFEVIGTVKAGPGGVAIEEYTGDFISVPREFLHGRKPEDFFVLKVHGDSMYPNLMAGDNILVLKSSDVDSGVIGVVIYNGFEATIKRIIKYPDRIELIAINPAFAPIIIREKDSENFQILGKLYTMIRQYN